MEDVKNINRNKIPHNIKREVSEVLWLIKNSLKLSTKGTIWKKMNVLSIVHFYLAIKSGYGKKSVDKKLNGKKYSCPNKTKLPQQSK